MYMLLFMKTTLTTVYVRIVIMSINVDYMFCLSSLGGIQLFYLNQKLQVVFAVALKLLSKEEWSLVRIRGRISTVVCTCQHISMED